jgi:hypothetical protein
MMKIPFTRWYPAIGIRESRRYFNPKQPLSGDILSNLKKTCEEFHPFPEARVELISETPDKIFNFIFGSYSIIRNPSAALVFIGDMRQSHVHEAVGYTGEAAVLEATALGLGTCWVAGFFSPAVVKQQLHLADYESILAVSPLGYSPFKKTLGEKTLKGFARHRKRKPLTELVSGLAEKDWHPWIQPALEAARIAPSATNRQPWRFNIQNNSITISTDSSKLDFKVSKRLDCGIAMLHLEISALNSNIHGRWDFLDPPSIARFVYGK